MAIDFQKQKEMRARLQGIKTAIALKNGDSIALVLEEIQKLIDFVVEIPKGDKGDTVHGKDYMLTESDRKDIALKVHVPARVIERTETIREIPLITKVTEVVKETTIIETPERLTPEKLLAMLRETGIPLEMITGIPQVPPTIREMPNISLFGGRNSGRGSMIVRNGDVPMGQDIRIINVIGSGVSVYRSGDGIVTFDITGGGSGGGSSIGLFTDEENPSGAIDGVNTTYTLAGSPIAGSLKLYRNGSRQEANVDFTLSGTTITMIIPLESEETLLVDYRVTGTATGVFVNEEVPSGTVDGNNTSFTLAGTPIAGSVRLFKGGFRLESNIDYTISGSTITMSLAPEIGESLVSDYRTSGTASTNTQVDEEVPTGTIDGNNTSFTLGYTPVSGSVKLYKGGQRLIRNTDYTLSSTTLTLSLPPEDGEILLVDYEY